AEVFQRLELRRAAVGALGHPLVGGDREVRADLVLEVVFVQPSAFQPGPDRHAIREGSPSSPALPSARRPASSACCSCPHGTPFRRCASRSAPWGTTAR